MGRQWSRELLLGIAMEQAARDCGCNPDDFLKESNTVVTPNGRCGSKKYLKGPQFCHMVSFGHGVVASVDARLADFMRSYLQSLGDPFRAFDTPYLNRIIREVACYNQSLCFMAEYFLPDPQLPAPLVPQDLEIRMLYGKEIARLYDDRRFSMALSYTTDNEKKDVIAAVGYLDGTLAGVAGASDDCEQMWQVGIDVLPQFRRRGVASALVWELSRQILELDKVPFYGAAWSNLASKRTAIQAGYRQSWVEISVKDNNFTEKLF